MAAHIFAQAIGGAGRACFHRPVLKKTLDVGCERGGRRVSAVAIFLDGLHGDAVEIAVKQADQLWWLHAAKMRGGFLRVPSGADPGARSGRIFFAKLAQYFGKGLLLPKSRIKRQTAS